MVINKVYYMLNCMAYVYVFINVQAISAYELIFMYTG